MKNFFCVANTYEVIEILYISDEYDELLIKYNKVFKTRTEAQEYADYLKAIAERTYKFSKEEWENENLIKYTFIYNHSKKRFETHGYCYCNLFMKFTFKTKEEAQAFIDEYGSMILKYEM